MSTQSSFPKGLLEMVSGRCIVLVGDDIDSDRIIPARFLKCVSFKDLGGQVFKDDRVELKGKHPFEAFGCYLQEFLSNSIILQRVYGSLQ